MFEVFGRVILGVRRRCVRVRSHLAEPFALRSCSKYKVWGDPIRDLFSAEIVFLLAAS